MVETVKIPYCRHWKSGYFHFGNNLAAEAKKGHKHIQKAGETMATTTYQPLIKAIDAYLQKADDDLTEMFEEEGRAEPKDSVKAIGSIEDKVEDSLSKETNRIISAIKKHKTLAALLTAGVLDEIFSDNTCRNEIKEIMSDELNALVPKLVKCYVRNVDAELKINSVSKRTLAWIDNWSGELADMMKLSDKETISKIIQDGLTHDNDIASVTRAIMDSGIRDEYYRARRVAVTEVLRADNVSKQEAAMQNPCIKEKMWRHTGAHKNEPRENHVAMDGQIVAADQPFTLTGKDGTVYYPMCPVDPSLPPEESINCHCVSQDIVDEDILGMPLEERQRLQQEAIDSMDKQWEEELNAKNRVKAGIEETMSETVT